jgi:hypothetical protein
MSFAWSWAEWATSIAAPAKCVMLSSAGAENANVASNARASKIYGNLIESLLIVIVDTYEKGFG